MKTELLSSLANETFFHLRFYNNFPVINQKPKKVFFYLSYSYTQMHFV